MEYQLILQILVAHILAIYTLNKILWETYKTHVKQKTRNNIIKLNWNSRKPREWFGFEQK
jgi:hypothetical protein